MGFEICRINSPFAQSVFEVFAPMKSLTAGGDLHSLEQQVEAAGRAGRSARCAVKGTPGERKTKHEYGGDTGFAFGQLTQLAFRLGIKVIG
jgi:hypothetical protein